MISGGVMAAPRNSEDPPGGGSNAGSGGTLLHYGRSRTQDTGYNMQHTGYRNQRMQNQDTGRTGQKKLDAQPWLLSRMPPQGGPGGFRIGRSLRRGGGVIGPQTGLADFCFGFLGGLQALPDAP